MNDENKKLISHEELTEIMYNHIKPELDKCCSNLGGYWDYRCVGAHTGFGWKLHTHSIVGDRDRYIWTHNCGNCLKIYNNSFDIVDHETTNIKVFEDHVEFVEGSKFIDFSREFMYGLYLKIKEVVEGNNTEEGNING